MVMIDSAKPNSIEGLMVTDTLTLEIAETNRKHAIALQLVKPNCIYLYDCVFSHRFRICHWSGRAICVIAEEES